MSILICTGRVGSDAEVRTTTDGTKVVSFSVADDIGWGEKKRTQWLKAIWFGERAVKVAQYITKGSTVEIHGTPEIEVWMDKGKNEPRGSIKVLVNDVKLHGGRKPKDEREDVVTYKDVRRVPARGNNDMDSDIPL